MTGARVDFAPEPSVADADLLTGVLGRADHILIKKLSNNDRDWAHLRGKHQAGVYMPRAERDGGFFPPLVQKERETGSPIREVFINTLWPQVGEEKRSRLVHYTSKGPETHLTRLPKGAFAGLLPASFLIVARVGDDRSPTYVCLTIDSGSDEAGLLVQMFGLGPDFLIGIFEPATIQANERDKVLDLADQVIAAWMAGTIGDFARTNATMPSTIDLARLARKTWLDKNGLTKTDPFILRKPGDVLLEISRRIELDLFREYQRRERSVELVRRVLGDTPRIFSASDIIRRLVDEIPQIDALMLSAAQQRKSRAGYSYEHHIESMLTDGNIPFEKQVIIEAKKRPDFILPSLRFIDSGRPGAGTGLILSAKTTLRERWKQVEREKGSRRLFLTTVDENIAGNAIEDMASIGVHLVIPESLRESKLSEYSGHNNVLSFRDFCDGELRPNIAVWTGRAPTGSSSAPGR